MFGFTRRDWLCLLPILLASAFVATFRSGAAGLIDPDEPFYALTAREMLESGDWVTPTLFGQPQFEKPVLAYWIYAALFRIFGAHEWAARLGPMLAALGVLVATAVLAKSLLGRARAVFLSTALLASSGVFIVLSRIVLTDMFLCLFTTSAFAAFARGWRDPAARPIAWRIFFVFMGLGFLTKGPLGALLPLGPVFLYAVCFPQERIAQNLPWKSGLLLFSAVTLPWYALAASRHGWFLPHFFLHENVRRFFVAEHRSFDRPYFYPIVLLAGFFPWSFVMVSALAGRSARLNRGLPPLRSGRIFLMLSSAAIFVFFALARSKLASYVFPVFPLLAVLTGDWLDRLIPALGRRASLPMSLRAGCFLGWIVLPATLVGALMAYERRQNLGNGPELWAAGALCVLPCAAAYALLVRKRFAASFAALSAMAVFFSMAAFGWILPRIDRYLSSRPMIEDFERDGLNPKKGLLLANKMSARGVSYYSGNSDVAVVSSNPKAFYTPHPVPMISAPEDLDRIEARRYPLYGILGNKEIRHLREISGARYSIRILDANAQRAIVRLDRARA